MDYLARISELLYVGLCRNKCIGTPTEVTIRREVLEMWDMIVGTNDGHNGCIVTGSFKEGFRFKSSDLDLMSWLTACKVINDLSQVGTFQTSNVDVILMEHTKTPPGFVLLKLLTATKFVRLPYPKVKYRKGRYISSSKLRNNYHHSLMSSNTFGLENLRSHGPCSSFHLDNKEYDISMCFACQYWPHTALSWFDRCQHQSWPSQIVLKEIMSNGCHVMPIGSETDSNELDWRISFSLAEQKLIYSMNHTQFLCYGVLKIFLKEVLSFTRREYLLCSYFMKTILFWEIQNNPDNLFWCPTNLLTCLWMCYKRLCRCVFDSYCPNFFIPENNMFKHKVIGASREMLLSQLYGYYEMKELCILLSHTLGSIILPALCNPLYRKPFSSGHILSQVDMDKCIKREILITDSSVESIEDCLMLLNSITKLSKLQLSQIQFLTLQYVMSKLFVNTAFFVAHHSSFKTNRTCYMIYKLVAKMLKLSSRIGCLSQILYFGIYYYSTGQYGKVLYITTFCKQEFSESYVLYNGLVDRKKYNIFVGRLPLGKRMKVSWIDFVIRLNKNILYRTELYFEETVRKENGTFALYASPFVLVHMLSVLCNYRLGNRAQYLQSLTDLQTLLLYDNGRCIPIRVKDISWQILGICQHVVGDLHGALLSYQMSLRQIPKHKIQKATYYRIGLVLLQLYGKKMHA